ncbi:BapA prefix-like domain-containing protein, partial [Ahrensia kielensis]
MSITTRTPDTVSIVNDGEVINVTVRGQGDVIVNADADLVVSADQVGNDLLVRMANGETFRLEGYFLNQDGIEVFFVDDNGLFSVLTEVLGGGEEALFLRIIPVAGADGVGALGVLGALAGVGAASAVIGLGSASSDTDSDPEDPEPRTVPETDPEPEDPDPETDPDPEDPDPETDPDPEDPDPETDPDPED